MKVEFKNAGNKKAPADFTLQVLDFEAPQAGLEPATL